MTPSDTLLKRSMSAGVETPKPVKTGMSAMALRLVKFYPNPHGNDLFYL